MRLGISLALLLGFCSQGVSADEPHAVQGEAAIGQQRLLARIEALEQRVSRLESATRQRDAVPVPPPQPPRWNPPWGPNAPEAATPYRPRLAPPAPPQSVPRSPSDPYAPLPAVPRPPTPPPWKQFEFNGQLYYIVPVNQATTAAQS